MTRPTGYGLSSAELAAVSAMLGRIPNQDEYMEVMNKLGSMSDEVYRYMNFDQIEEYRKVADSVQSASAA